MMTGYERAARVAAVWVAIAALWALPMAVSAQSPTLELVSQWGGTVRAVAAEGSTVYFGEGPRLVVVDASVPTAPVEIGRSAALPNAIVDLAVSNGYVYAACMLYGVRILSVEDLANPVEVGFIRAADCANAVWISGDMAFIADRYEGLTIASIADPSAPQRLGSMETHDQACDVAVAGDYAYMADGRGGLRVLRIDDPTSPEEVAVVEAIASVTGVTIDGTYAYVLDDETLRIVSIADPALPREVGALKLTLIADVAVSGDIAYVATSWGGLRTVSVADRAAPIEIETAEISGESYAIALSDDCLHVANGAQGLLVLGLADPRAPVVAGALDTASYVSNLAVSGDLACVTNSIEGVHLVSLADPDRPTEVGFLALPGVRCAELVRERAYIGVGDVFVVLDVSDPCRPIELGRTSLPAPAESVRVRDRYAYVLTDYAGLVVISLLDLSLPTIVASFPIDGYSTDLAIMDDRAYIAAGGLHILSIADPLNPALVGRYVSDESTSSLFVDEERAFLNEGSAFSVLSIVDPTYPVRIAQRVLGLRSVIEIVGGVAVLGLEWRGVVLVDLSDLDRLPVITGLDTADRPVALELSGDLICVADQEGGLFVLRLHSNETET